MFFTPELLSRRDSGFGLLWLAATLGAKSSFRKLPKRSVASADIVQLCNLIADPPEPLALRLSSNLMIGAARVYKVKQEIFLADVTACFTTLKKAVQEIRMSDGADLNMAQTSVRPDAVTVRIDPSAAYALEFEHLFPDWDNQASLDKGDESESDEEYDPVTKKKKKKGKRKDTSLSQVGAGRGNLHTLDENYEYLLSGSFDVSFDATGLGMVGTSSSQAGFAFEDDFLGAMDVGNDIGDELARELGADWGGALDLPAQSPVPDFHMGPDQDQNEQPAFGADVDPFAMDMPLDDGLPIDGQEFSISGHAGAATSPTRAVSHSLHPEDQQDSQDFQNDEPEKPAKKLKRVRLLLDSRTELSNEELQRARALYMEEQAQIRRGMDEKRAEKHVGNLLEEMILGAPRGVHAPVLVDFWLENFKVQVEARSGQLVLDTEGQPPQKRRRVGEGAVGTGGEVDHPLAADGADQQFDFGGDYPAPAHEDMFAEFDSRLRSSEEPGQARQASRPPSLPGSHLDLLGHGLPIDFSASQRSAMFPWDNAGGLSSSVAGAPFEMVSSDRFSLSAGRGPRGSSRGSRRESPMFPRPDSPAGLDLGDVRMDGDAFEFNVPDVPGVETQESDMNLLTLERHSFDFLEYCKIQANAFPSDTNSVGFDDIVPAATSTAHVAAAAFYHCLVLATKDLIRVDQDESFAPLRITVK
ncbi:hypothetical protein EIP91_008929 [Steccherinum ochraceum]|uniref:Rad21/Rec8-like protein N-terminal domain-containing protein n=1 Tax=Steccherinum ochraceum TaxID=92696 RepID=A0A4R0S267_9APHY|nr:hypothetical protein EIP91_008929 [Steccherinum ochraceum]